MLRDDYFTWLIGKVGYDRKTDEHMYDILAYLFSQDFFYIHPMDSGRFDDGVDLRYQFAAFKGIEYHKAANELDNRPCSVLEMLVALSIGVEEIMFDSIMADTYDAGYWFRVFMKNLGIDDGDADVPSILSRFLNREYDSDGTGSIVRISDPYKDCREADIWMQVTWYLTENY